MDLRLETTVLTTKSVIGFVFVADEAINKKALKADVEDEYRKWSSVLTFECESSMNENEVIQHFSVVKTFPHFICLVWKVLFEGKQPSIIIYK